jgi:hypothetical protein
MEQEVNLFSVAAKNYGRKVMPLHSFMLYWLWGKTLVGLINTGCY